MKKLTIILIMVFLSTVLFAVDHFDIMRWAEGAGVEMQPFSQRELIDEYEEDGYWEKIYFWTSIEEVSIPLSEHVIMPMNEFFLKGDSKDNILIMSYYHSLRKTSSDPDARPVMARNRIFVMIVESSEGTEWEAYYFHDSGIVKILTNMVIRHFSKQRNVEVIIPYLFPVDADYDFSSMFYRDHLVPWGGK